MIPPTCLVLPKAGLIGYASRAWAAYSRPQTGGGMKTILFVETGSGYGGSAVCLDHLLRTLNTSRLRCLVLYRAEGTGIQRIRAFGVPTVPMRKRAVLFQLIRLIVEEKVDLIHANNEIYSHAMTIVAARVTRRKCLMHMRGIRALTRRERWLVPWIHQFVVLSQFACDFYAKQGIPVLRMALVHDGIDLEQFSHPIGQEQARGLIGVDGSPVIGMVSRLVPMKGHRDAVEALAILVKRHPAARLVFVGGDPHPDNRYLKSLQAYVSAYGLQGNVIFTGWRNDIAEVTAAFDVAVQASHYLEGFGSAAMEAMALGKTVVATRVGGLPELIEDGRTGILVAPGEPEQLAAAISRLLEDEALRQQMGDAAKARVQALFNQKQLTAKIESIYARMLSGGAA